jgi:putative transposase
MRSGSPEIEYIGRNIQPDYIQIVVSFPPKYSIASVVQLMKQNTTSALREKYKFLRERYWGGGGIWSVRYFASTVGAWMRRQSAAMFGIRDLGQAKIAF